jgi:aspartate/methionine/tyrosine aminotransferase
MQDKSTKMKPASRTELIQEYFFSKKLEEIRVLESQGRPIVSLGIGSPDLMPPSVVIETLREGCYSSDAYRYKGYKGIVGLKEEMADWYLKTYGVSVHSGTEILPLIGSKEAIGFISLAYLEKGDKVLVPNPGYPTYTSAAHIAGAEVVYYNLVQGNDWYPDLAELESLMDDSVKMIWINYPNMPTGQDASLSVFKSLIEFAKKHSILICNDNPYSLTLNEKPQSIMKCEGAKEVVIELNSLSKSHNLAGARVGMVIGSKEILEPVFKIQSNFSSGMFQPIQEAAISALKLDKEWNDSLNEIYQQRKDVARQIFDELGCIYNLNDVGLFVWGKIPENISSGEFLSDALLYKADVFITPGLIFGSNGDDYLRISLCSPVEDLLLVLERIKKFNL